MRRLPVLVSLAAFFLAAMPASACVPAHVLFQPGSTRIEGEDWRMIDYMAERVRARPGLRWRLSPNSRGEGTPAENVREARLRAEAVRDALFSRGVPAASVEIDEAALAAVARMTRPAGGGGLVWVNEIDAAGEARRGCG